MNNVLDSLIQNQYVIEAPPQAASLETDPGGGIRLWVHIHKQYLRFGDRQTRGKINRGCCFSDPALLIRNRDNFCHMSTFNRGSSDGAKLSHLFFRR